MQNNNNRHEIYGHLQFLVSYIKDKSKYETKFQRKPTLIIPVLFTLTEKYICRINKLISYHDLNQFSILYLLKINWSTFFHNLLHKS